MSSPEQPVCLVTGGSAGIGLATASKFVAAGYRVRICGRDKARLQLARNQILVDAGCDTKSDLCDVCSVDVADAAALEQFVHDAVEAYGRLDVLVNNAGRAPLAAVDELPPEEFSAALAVNVGAVYHATRAAWPHLRRQGGGVIVNVSSMAAFDPFPGFSVYGACKAWVNLYTHATAAEGREHNIRVFAVCPGAVETELLRGLFPDLPAEQTLSPEQIAEAIFALASDSMQFASGSSVRLQK